MITKKEVGIALKEKIAKQEPIVQIGEWAYCIYWEHILDSDKEMDDILLTLNTLELGEGFYYT